MGILPQGSSSPSLKETSRTNAPENAKSAEGIPLSSSESLLWKKIFWASAFVFTLFRCVLSFDYGITSDEKFQKPLGDLTYDYFMSFGKQDSILRYNPDGVLINYGPMIDLFGTFTYRTLGMDDFEGRHLFITLFCSLLFVGCGLVAKEIGGWRAAFFALVLITLSPRIFGEAMNNPKDPPFAAAYIFALYRLLLFVKGLPNPSWKNVLWLAIGIGLCIGVRAGGLILVPYILLYCTLEILSRKELRETVFSSPWTFLQHTGVKLLAMFVIGYFVGILFWPYALTRPFTQVFEALASLTNTPVLPYTLFEGTSILSAHVPWYYVPKYIWMTTPIVVLALILLGMLFLPILRRYFTLRHLIMLLFFGLFPICYVIYKESYFYTGWRHTYFTYVPLVSFAGIACEGILRKVGKKSFQYVVGGIVAMGLFSPMRFMLSNHPNEYTYYNEFVGGINGTLGEYEPDYFANSAKQAMDWLAKNEDLSKPAIIASNHLFQVNYYAKKISPSLHTRYMRYRERYQHDWDYAILFQTSVDPQMLKNGYFTPQYGLVHTVKADNVPLCVILKRTNKWDVEGINAVLDRENTKGIELLTQVIKENPQNELAIFFLGIGLANQGNVEEGSKYIQKAIEITPNNVEFLYYYAEICIYQKKSEEAIACLQKVIKECPDYAEGYHLLAKAYDTVGDTSQALLYKAIYKEMSAKPSEY